MQYGVVFVISLFFFFFGTGFIYPQNLQMLDLGEIVVTPLKIDTPTRDLPSSVSIVTKDEIEMSTANSATDILNLLPGVFIHKTGPFGRADVTIRGFGSRGRRVMVLVDGKPEKMGLFGCTVTHALPLDNVERIEVVRGSSSVLYGSDALGGVVNIITKKPQKKYEGDVTISYGSYDTQIYRIRSGADLGDFGYYFSFDKRTSRGHLPNSDYTHNNFALRVQNTLTEDLDLSFSFRYFDGFKREPEPSPADTWNRYKRGSFDLTLEGKLLQAEQMIKVYRNFGHHRFSDGWHSKDYTTGCMFHFSFNPKEDNRLILGTEFRELGGKVYSGGIPGKYDKSEFAFFLHDEQKFFNNNVILSGGLRYNHDSIAQDIVCPSAGFVWHISSKTDFRGSFERGFRAPGLNELRFFAISNPDLNPEKSWNYEWGLTHQFTPNFGLDFTYFIIKAKDFIAVRSGKFQNIKKVNFKGIEAILNYSVSKNLRMYLSFTHLHSGKYTTGRPENELDLTLLYSKDKIKFSLNGQYVDNYFAADDKKEAIPNFFVVNTKLGYEISNSFEVYLGIDNLFNVEHKVYVDLPGSSAGIYTQPKRSFTFGMTYRW